MEEKKTHKFSVDDVVAEALAKRENKTADKKILEMRSNAAPEISVPAAPVIKPETAPPMVPARPEITEQPSVDPQPEKEKLPPIKAKEEEKPAEEPQESAPAEEEKSVPTPPLTEAPKVQETSSPVHTDGEERKNKNPPQVFYRNQHLPVHFLNLNFLADALREEASVYSAPESEQEEEGYADNPLEAVMGLTEFDMREYEEPGDASSVMAEITGKVKEITMRVIGTGVCFALLLIAAFVCECNHIGSFTFDLSFGTVPYLAVNIVLLIAVGILNAKSVSEGLKGLFTLQANHDSSVSIALVAALIQCVAAFSFTDRIEAGEIHLYAAVAAMGFLVNTLGRLVMIRRMSKNFKMLTSPDMKFAVETVEDNAKAVRLAGEYIERAPLAAYQHEMKFPRDFVFHSVKADPSRFVSQMIAPIGFLASLILLAASFIMFNNFADAITAFAVSACICVPMANLICVNLPVTQLSTLARKWGGMISGYSALEYFSQTNMVLVDAEDLFPKGTIELESIKSFGSPQMEEVILSASALIHEMGGPLSTVFEQVIKNKMGVLPDVQDANYEEGLGFCGWCRGKQVLVGNRKMMANYGIDMPPKDIETKFHQGGKQLLYIALGGSVCAMLILHYRADSRRAAELAGLEKNDVTVIVRTNDVNITSGLIASCFGVDGRMIRILPSKCSDIYEEAVLTEAENADAVMLTKGRTGSMLRLLSACIRQRSNITVAIMLQIIAVVLGFVFVAFIVCYSGFGQLTTTALLLYELFCLALIIFVPKIRKP